MILFHHRMAQHLRARHYSPRPQVGPSLNQQILLVAIAVALGVLLFLAQINP